MYGGRISTPRKNCTRRHPWSTLFFFILPLLAADLLLQNNVLIDGNLHIRITDFGLSAFAHPNTTSTGIVGGSTRWMAPELLTSSSQESPSFQSDVYAVGITCIEVG